MSEENNNVPTVVEDMAGVDSALLAVEPMQGSEVESIALPGFDEVDDDKKIIKSIRDVFRGFDFNAKDDFGTRFPTLDALTEYTRSAIEDIRDARTKSAAESLLNQGACLGRFWCVGKALDSALNNADYGVSAYNQLATALGKSVGYIYKWRAVAKKLTLSQAYLLGIRGVEQTTVVNLAYTIQDDATRDALISGFVSAVVDGADEQSRLEAIRKLKQAINDIPHNNLLEVGNTDPATGGNEAEVTPEFTAALKLFADMHRKYTPVSDEKFFDRIASVCEEFFLMDNVPDGEEQLTRLREQAEELKTMLTATVNMTTDAIAQLDSIVHCDLTKSEDNTNDPAGDADGQTV